VVLGGCADTGRVDGVSHPAAPALDMTLATPLAAVVVIGSSADQGRGDRVADLPELGHPCDERRGSRSSEARNTLDDLGTRGKRRCGLDLGGDDGLKLADFRTDPLQHTCIGFPGGLWCCMLVLSLQAGLEI